MRTSKSKGNNKKSSKLTAQRLCTEKRFEMKLMLEEEDLLMPGKKANGAI
jgi:hypothetical protein